MQLQLEAPRAPVLAEAVQALSVEDSSTRGEVFTAQGVVHCILDLACWTIDQDLPARTLLEPSAGTGSFLLPAVRRLLSSAERLGRAPETLHDAIRAIELNDANFSILRERTLNLLSSAGISSQVCDSLLNTWLIQDDFLLSPGLPTADTIVGNPPYVRQERIPAPLLKEYRRRYRTIYDRADLYVPFFERCLQLLSENARLVFICTDRWMKNKYGGPLRELIADNFSIETIIRLTGGNAFDQDVTTYPAITSVSSNSPSTVRTSIVRAAVSDLNQVTKALPSAQAATIDSIQVDSVEGLANGRAPWLTDSIPVLKAIRALEAKFGTIESAGCKVGIGVATGADRVYVRDYSELPIESDRKLRLAMAKDLVGGRVAWNGKGLANPFRDGSLVDLAEFPMLSDYFAANSEVLRKRHVAKKNPKKWFKTIDKVDATLQTTPKLLLPDIKGDNSVSYDSGEFYPHHNVYYITSTEWELRALQAVLSSSLALMFIGAYSVRMSGGYLRFQAQFLRRIRLPQWQTLSEAQQDELTNAGLRGDLDLTDTAVAAAFGISEEEYRPIRAEANRLRIR